MTNNTLPRSIDRGLIEADLLSLLPIWPGLPFRDLLIAASLKRCDELRADPLPPAFRDLLIAASLKQFGLGRLGLCRGRALPRSIDRGLIEA